RSAGAAVPSLKQRSPRRSTGTAQLGEGQPSPRTGRPERRGRGRSSPAPPRGPGAPARGCREADRGSSSRATAPRPFRQRLRDWRRGSAPHLKRSVSPAGSSLGAPPRTRQRPVTPAAQRWLPRLRSRRALDPGARLAALGLRWGVDSLEGCSCASRPAGHAGLHHHRTCLRGRLAPQAGASGHASQLPQGGSAAWEQQGPDQQGCTALHLAAMYLGDGEAASGDLGRR
uniref:Uncharacterized protein n=1 Tax=Rhinopithecus bieti TaxID=61621 RepID=A0A2K6LYH5_RHIBE